MENSIQYTENNVKNFRAKQTYFNSLQDARRMADQKDLDLHGYYSLYFLYLYLDRLLNVHKPVACENVLVVQSGLYEVYG
jgi:hypothetical protein